MPVRLVEARRHVGVDGQIGHDHHGVHAGSVTRPAVGCIHGKASISARTALAERTRDAACERRGSRGSTPRRERARDRCRRAARRRRWTSPAAGALTGRTANDSSGNCDRRVRVPPRLMPAAGSPDSGRSPLPSSPANRWTSSDEVVEALVEQVAPRRVSRAPPRPTSANATTSTTGTTAEKQVRQNQLGAERARAAGGGCERASDREPRARADQRERDDLAEDLDAAGGSRTTALHEEEREPGSARQQDEPAVQRAQQTERARRRRHATSVERHGLAASVRWRTSLAATGGVGAVANAHHSRLT